jgi:hypothetical protein
MEARAGMIAGRATYTVDEVAVLLDLSRGNAYRYVREGGDPSKAGRPAMDGAAEDLPRLAGVLRG